MTDQCEHLVSKRLPCRLCAAYNRIVDSQTELRPPLSLEEQIHAIARENDALTTENKKLFKENAVMKRLYQELKYATRSIHATMHERDYSGDKSLNVPLLDCPHENCIQRLKLLAEVANLEFEDVTKEIFLKTMPSQLLYLRDKIRLIIAEDDPVNYSAELSNGDIDHLADLISGLI